MPWPAAGDACGAAVALSGDGQMLVVGKPGVDGAGARTRAASASDWVQLGGDLEGVRSATRRALVRGAERRRHAFLVGAPSEDSGANAGETIMYDCDGSVWVDPGDAVGGAAGDESRSALAVSGDAAVADLRRRARPGLDDAGGATDARAATV